MNTTWTKDVTSGFYLAFVPHSTLIYVRVGYNISAIQGSVACSATWQAVWLYYCPGISTKYGYFWEVTSAILLCTDGRVDSTLNHQSHSRVYPISSSLTLARPSGLGMSIKGRDTRQHFSLFFLFLSILVHGQYTYQWGDIRDRVFASWKLFFWPL